MHSMFLVHKPLPQLKCEKIKGSVRDVTINLMQVQCREIMA